MEINLSHVRITLADCFDRKIPVYEKINKTFSLTLNTASV